MKRLKGGLIVVILLSVFFIVAVVALAKFDQRVADSVALEEITKIIQSKQRQREIGIPEEVTIKDDQPDDTNTYVRLLQYNYQAEPEGVVVLEFHASRGVGFLPLFNRKQDIKLLSAEFIK